MYTLKEDEKRKLLFISHEYESVLAMEAISGEESFPLFIRFFFLVPITCCVMMFQPKLSDIHIAVCTCVDILTSYMQYTHMDTCRDVIYM
jgi:hypothetical protein